MLTWFLVSLFAIAAVVLAVAIALRKTAPAVAAALVGLVMLALLFPSVLGITVMPASQPVYPTAPSQWYVDSGILSPWPDGTAPDTCVACVPPCDCIPDC